MLDMFIIITTFNRYLVINNYRYSFIKYTILF